VQSCARSSSDHCGDGKGFVRQCSCESRRVWRLSGGLGGLVVVREMR
jgi:hypothetical protein